MLLACGPDISTKKTPFNLETVELMQSLEIQKSIVYIVIADFFFCLGFFHENSRFTGQQEKGEVISLIPLYHFHPLHRHVDISRVITAESSPLHIGFRAQVANH